MSASLSLLNPVPKIDYDSFDKSLIEVHKRIAVLKGACFGLPNPKLLLSPTVLREALASSEIENIVTTLASVLQAQLFSEAEQSPADKEVMRYNRALNSGLELMKNIPLGSRVIKNVHDALMPNESGYRRDQVYIKNTATGEIVYKPPGANEIEDLISDLEKFIHDDSSNVDPIIKTIMTHYQFEAIHPFSDGNGRTGRILMVLCLIYYELLNLPVLFISGYINSHKSEYYSALRNVTEKADWNAYINYMLTAFIEQSEKSTTVLLKIKDLHDNIKRQIRRELPKIYSRDLIDELFNRPLITPTAYSAAMGVTYQTASTHLKKLKNIGIMNSFKAGRYTVYANMALIDLLSGNDQ